MALNNIKSNNLHFKGLTWPAANYTSDAVCSLMISMITTVSHPSSSVVMYMTNA